MILRYTALAALCLLCVQLTQVDFSVRIAERSFGYIGNVIEKTDSLFPSAMVRISSSSEETTRYDEIVFVGDVLLARHVEQLMLREGADYPYRGIQLFTSPTSTAVVGNFESSMLVNHTKTAAYQMRFSVDTIFLPALRSAGFTHMSQANNHSLDFGNEAFLFSKEQLEKNKIKVFGHGIALDSSSISYLDSTSGRVAMVAINATAQTPDVIQLEAVLKEASEQSVFQIAYVHWGTEYDLVHNPAQEVLAVELVKAGADLIIGHHPHVVQDIALIDGVPVLYSLGNFIFDQYFSEEVQNGLVVSLSLNASTSIKLTPVTSKQVHSQPHAMSEEERAVFLKNLAVRSDEALRDSIISGIIPLMSPVATSTKVAIMVQ